MSGDNEKQSSGDKSGEEQERSKGERRAAVGAGSISTADRAVISPPETEGSPEEVVSYQTSQVPVPPPEYRFGSGGDVVKEERGQQQGGNEQHGGKQKQNGEGGKQDPEQAGRQRQAEQKEQGGKQGAGKGQQQEKKQQNGKHDRDREHDHERDGDHQRRHKKKKKHHETAGQLNWKTMLVTAVLALVCGVGGAWGYSAMFGPSKSDKQDGDSSKSDSSKSDSGKSDSDKGDKSGGKSGGNKGKDSGSGGASASEIPGFSSARDADTFKKELEHLAHRLDLLGGRIDQLTTNEDKTPPVLHTVQRKVTDLEREVDEVANLPSKFSRLEQKLSDLKQELVILKERMSGSELPLASEVTPSPNQYDANRGTATAADPADEATLKLATGLLHEGHYSQSYEVLRRLQRERPDDARVWYLSALAHGLSTDKWDGKTKQLAEHGIACERSGHPSHQAIDDALSGLSSVGKDWIASQRSEAMKR